MKDAAQPKSSRRVAKHHPRRRTYWIVAGLSAVVVVYFLFLRPPKDIDAGLADLFGPLEELGFTPNVGFSDLYEPGNVIQTRRADAGGKVKSLPSPLPFLWADVCFPAVEPRESGLVLPDSTGRSRASLHLGAQAISQLVPHLDLDDQAVAYYRLELGETGIRTLTTPQISRAFSEPCVDALHQARADGSPLEWFEVIVQTAVADGFRFEMDWHSDTSAEARASLERQAQDALSQGEVQVGLESEDEKTTVLQADERVVLGYRTLPIELPPAMANETVEEGRDPMPASPSAGAVEARLEIELREADGSWRQVRMDHPFHTGDYFRFVVTSSHKGWLYVFHRPPEGEISLLWPPDEAGSLNAIDVDTTFRAPRDPHAFLFEGSRGEELFYVAVAAEANAPDLVSTSQPLVATQERVQNFIVRGLHDSARNVVLAPLPKTPSSLVFQAPHKADGTIAAVELRLQHQG